MGRSDGSGTKFGAEAGLALEPLLPPCFAEAVSLRLVAQAYLNERDAAVRALKGGTFWTRFKRGTKTAAGASAGAAIGAAACSGADGAGVAHCADAGAHGGFIISHF